MQPSFHKPTPSAVGRNRKVPVTVETCGLYWPWRVCVWCVGGLGHPQLTLLALIVPRFDPSARRSLWAAANTTGLLHLLPPGALWVGWCHRRGAKSIVRLQRKNGAAFVLISYENTSRWVKLQLICQSRRKCGKNLTHGKKTRAGKLTIN